jgi:hypothetical protein
VRRELLVTVSVPDGQTEVRPRILRTTDVLDVLDGRLADKMGRLMDQDGYLFQGPQGQVQGRDVDRVDRVRDERGRCRELLKPRSIGQVPKIGDERAIGPAHQLVDLGVEVDNVGDRFPGIPGNRL